MKTQSDANLDSLFGGKLLDGAVKMPLREVIFEQLAKQIKEGKILPGTRLIERKVAEELGVSRMSLREAFQRLEAEGFVKILPRRGAFVAEREDVYCKDTTGDNGDGIDKQVSTEVDIPFIPPVSSPDLGGDIRNRTGKERVIAAANKLAIDKIRTGEAKLTALRPASEVIEGLGQRKIILHAGPPVLFKDMCGTMRGALIGAVLFEKWADSEAEAIELLNSGEVSFASNHDYGAVGPMAGVISPSMTVLVVENKRYQTQSFAPLMMGGAHTLVLGAHDKTVIDKLRWLCDEFSSVIDAAINSLGYVDIRALMIQGLQMGDELHNRTHASSLLLLRELASAISKKRFPASDRALEQLASFPDQFLPMAMAASKAMLMPAHNIENCSIVTAMARNGVDFGIRVSGLGDEWFSSPSPYVSGVYFPGFGLEDADRDLGDSAITETLGFGALSGAASPLVSQMVGASASQLVDINLQMYKIAVSSHDSFRIPSLNFAGTPLGIDIRKVVETGLTPYIDSAIAHRSSGTGQIGAGLASAPMGCFVSALHAFEEKLEL